MFQNIVCAVDGSAHALRAAQTASELAAKLGAKLTFLTVTKELKITEAVKHYIEIEHLAGEPQYVLDEYTEEVLTEARDAARAAGVKDFRSEVKTGQPARAIVNFAERSGADCIVLGGRGHGDIGGLFLGIGIAQGDLHVEVHLCHGEIVRPLLRLCDKACFRAGALDAIRADFVSLAERSRTGPVRQTQHEPYLQSVA